MLSVQIRWTHGDQKLFQYQCPHCSLNLIQLDLHHSHSSFHPTLSYPGLSFYVRPVGSLKCCIVLGKRDSFPISSIMYKHTHMYHESIVVCCRVVSISYQFPSSLFFVLCRDDLVLTWYNVCVFLIKNTSSWLGRKTVGCVFQLSKIMPSSVHHQITIHSHTTPPFGEWNNWTHGGNSIK